MGGKGSWAASRAYTCNGTSLGDTCLTSLLNSMKFERDKIRTFTNQKKRAESFKTLIGNKGGKNDQFGNTTTYLLMALGGNMTNFNCSGKASLTTEAAATYTVLENCSASISAACAVPNNTANFTLLDTCETVYSEIKTKNAACLKLTTNGTAACSCWAESANITAAAKKLSDDCDSRTTQLEMKSLKKACLATFSACKKAEDSSVEYIMTCSQDSSSSSLTDWDTDTDSEDTTVDTVLATTASVRPRLSPRLLLILTFTATEDTDWDTDTVSEDTTVDTVLATTASVRPRLSPRLLLILTFTAT